MSARSAWAAFALWGLGVACGSSSSGPSPQADAATGDDAGGQCPATVARTLGAPCVGEGLACAPEYLCGLVQVPLECQCAHGVFACTDVTGRVLAAGATPGCPAASDAGCPPDENSANLAPCGEVDIQCTYPSACGLGVDSCDCTQGALVEAGPGLLFVCSPAVCEVTEGGVVAVDAGSEGG